MDELELLKKDWQKKDDGYPKLSYNDIYRMILKKSSSIVKWIFIISILEFAFWSIISFFLKDNESIKQLKAYDVDYIFTQLIAIGYIVLAYFFYLFFMNYRKISVTDNAKVLMENILKTRKTVKYYVAFNLVFMVISAFISVFIQLGHNEVLINKAQQAAANGEAFLFYGKIMVVTLLLIAVVVGVFLLFYYLVYGILLKRLNRNYKELKKLEV